MNRYGGNSKSCNGARPRRSEDIFLRHLAPLSMKKALLRDLIELGYFPDHRGYRRSSRPGLVAHMLPAQRKPIIQLMQRKRVISSKHGMLAGLYVTGGGVVYDQESQRDFLSLT